ncbi:hypothetical protein ACFZBU_47895 [Embleya sp. NPDC008237]|uniref:hypothetical protein n=1 Tax=Embleya sp. NPDC008237 TaxID=3363978 RepID=UPI0036DFBCA6
MIEDSKVGRLLALLERSGVPSELDDVLAGRPGPPGLPYRAVLTGLMLSSHYLGRATLADAWWILFHCLRPKARSWLGVPEHAPADDHARVATSRRVYRTFDRITTALDPARRDRRRRLPAAEADQVAAAWESPANATTVHRLARLANRLVLAPVVSARDRGHLRGWEGHVGVDATAVPVMSRPASRRTGLGSIEASAGWHFSGGATEGVFGYSAHLLVAAHRGCQNPVRYPQLCLGLALDTPGKRIGANAIALLNDLAELGLPTGVCAADRAYTGQRPEEFQVPVRRLGYALALDYKVTERGPQGSFRGAPIVDGHLACPLMPDVLRGATIGREDKEIRHPDEDLAAAITARAPFWLHRKQGPDQRGSIRVQCPAAGPSPTLNCPRREHLHPPTPSPDTAPPPRIVRLADARGRRAHPAARPTVLLPDDERTDPPPRGHQPAICRQSTMTVHADQAAPKYRQDQPYLSPAWEASYKSVRSHTEGKNSQVKGIKVDIGNPKHRPVRGRVGHHLTVAVLLMIANLDMLDRWRHRTAGSAAPDERDRAKACEPYPADPTTHASDAPDLPPPDIGN